MVMQEPAWLHATAILITDRRGGLRFFREWNNAGALHTAWSLAGATLFLCEPVENEHPDLKKVKARLTREGREWRQIVVRAEP